MNFDQGQFNFDAPAGEDGYLAWREELDARRAAFEKRWGVILGRRVRVKLLDRDLPLEGKLVLLDEENATHPSRRHRNLRFHLQGKEFCLAEIESVVRLD